MIRRTARRRTWAAFIVMAVVLAGSASGTALPVPRGVGGRCVETLVLDGQTAYRQYDVFKMGLDGKAERVTFNRRSFDPSLSPDGKRLAFARAPAGTWSESGYETSSIAVSAATRRAHVKTWRSETIDAWPSWSPDGTQIAFTRTRPGEVTARLVVARSDGTHQQVVRRGVSPHTRPSWSNRGDRIAYVSSDWREVRIVDLDGGDGQVVSVPENEASRRLKNIDWSRDDSHLVLSDVNYESSIGVRELDLDSGDTRVISPTGTNGRYLSGGRIVFLEYEVSLPPAGQDSPQFLMIEDEAGLKRLAQLRGVDLAGALEDRCVQT